MAATRVDPGSDQRRAAEPWPVLPLAAIWGLVVAQPLYDVLRSAPEFFIEHGVSAVGVFVFSFLLSVVAPLGLALVVLVARRVFGRVVGSATVLGVVVVLGTGMGAQVTRHADSTPASLAIALAVAIGIALALAYRKSRLFAHALAWLALPAWTLIPGLFLLSAPIRSLWTASTVAVETGSVRETPVVVIVFDELPLASLVHAGDGIDAARYPHFADLASQSTWYRNAVTPSVSTSAAVPALLTGDSSPDARAPVAAEYPRNLFTALAQSHEMRVIERVTRLCPRRVCRPISAEQASVTLFGRDLALVYGYLITPSGWRHRLPAIDQTWRGFGGEARLDRESTGQPAISNNFELPDQVVASLTSGFGSSSLPTLHYLHLMLPHVPFRFLPSGQIYEFTMSSASRVSDTRRGPIAAPDEWALVQEYQRHLLQVEFADHLLGEILTALRVSEVWDLSLVVVAADHGISFVPGLKKRGGLVSLNVPLLVKRPGQTAGATKDKPVSLFDVLPTILDELAVDLDWEMKGQSLFSSRSGTRAFLPAADQVMDARLSAARSRQRWFPRIDERDGVFLVGPAVSLVGRPVDSCSGRTGGSSSSLPRATIARRALFEDVDPDGRFLPARVTGNVDFGEAAARRLDLAIAVNGTVAATTRSVGSGHGSFSAMIPPRMLAPGNNEVEIHLVREAGPPCLERLSSAAGDYELITEGRRLALSTPTGRRRIVRSDSARRFEVHERRSFFLVRASQVPSSAERVLVFYRSLFVGQLKDSEATRRRGIPRSQLRVPRALALRPDELRVIVLTDDGAFEAGLDWLP